MPGLSTNFDVEIDAVVFAGGIGKWTAVDGLGFEMAVEDREEGGNLFNKVKIPGHMSYTNIKLTRVIDSHSPQIMAWFAMAAQSFIPTSITIKLLGEGMKGTIAKWTFDKCVPVRYTGPALNVSGPKVSTETLEFTHHGLLGGMLGGAIAGAIGL